VSVTTRSTVRLSNGDRCFVHDENMSRVVEAPLPRPIFGERTDKREQDDAFKLKKLTRSHSTLNQIYCALIGHVWKIGLYWNASRSQPSQAWEEFRVVKFTAFPAARFTNFRSERKLAGYGVRRSPVPMVGNSVLQWVLGSHKSERSSLARGTDVLHTFMFPVHQVC
jgi:hypothetical protein